MKNNVIYRIWNTTNGKSYIGQTNNFKSRIQIHFSPTNNNKHQVIHKAIKKHGKESFQIEILESNVPNELMDKLEILHIRFHNSFQNGYNLTEGGGGKRGNQISQETRKKLSKAGKGNQNGLGFKLTPKHKEKLRKANIGNKYSLGRKITQEHRNAISQANKGTNNPNYGKQASKETKEKQAKAKRGKKLSAQHKQKIATGVSKAKQAKKKNAQSGQNTLSE